MSDKSILLRLEQQGQEVPRVLLPGSEAPGSGASENRYEVTGELARGGVGIVYRGRDGDLGRDVAMKVLRDEHLDRPELVQRFVEEAQVGGQLQHPGIVPVYELGVKDKRRPFFAMKLVKGHTLTELLAARADAGANRRALLADFAQACHTVAYAHSRGVIHRDLKPSNIMVGSFGEVQVVDWGFAKVLEKGGIADERRARRGVTVVATVRSATEGSASIAGSVMGTPAYMPPEQALGHVEDLTERADVFSLGAILCEILTGEPPYTGEPADLLAAAAHARLDDAWRRLDACDADAELKALARACLSALPKERPRSAREVADALSTHLAEAERRAHGARVRAAEERERAEEQRRARRQTVVLASAILLIALVGGGAYLGAGAAKAGRERERAAAFEAAIREATRLRAAGSDWPGARAAVQRAVGLAGADALRRREAEDLRARVEEDAAVADRAAEKKRAEAALLAALDEISLRRGDDMDARRTDEDYAAALPDFAALADFDRKVELAARIDTWALVRRTSPELKGLDARPLDEMARALDPDPWRNRLRDAVAKGDTALLRQLAAEVDPAAQDVHSLDLLGTALSVGGAPDAAADVLRRASDLRPDDFWIHLHLASAVAFMLGPLPMGDPTTPNDEAIRHYLAATALRPGSSAARAGLGSALAVKGDFDGAVSEYREALRLERGGHRVHREFSSVLDAKGDLDGAIAEMREAVRADPKCAFCRSKFGGLLGKAGDADGAIVECRESIRLNPTYAMAHHNLGVALTMKGDLDAAVAELREAIRIDPNLASAHHNLGVALLTKRDFDGAIQSFREALRLNPKNASTYHNLGIVLRSKRDLAGAVAAGREAVRLEPKNATYRLVFGHALRDMGDLDEALAEFRESLRLDGNLAEAHLGVGTVLEEKGDFDGAIRAMREATRLDPIYVAWINNLGTALDKRGDRSGAIAAWREAVRLKPDYALGWSNLAVALMEMRDIDSAVAACRESIRLEPDNVQSRNCLGSLLCDALGRYDEALAEFREALRINPKYAPAASNIGMALGKKGDPDGAIAAFREAARLDPTLPDPPRGLANVLLDKGDFAGAAAAFREAARLGPEPPYARQRRIEALRGAFGARVPGILEGKERPADVQECLGMAELCAYGTSFLPAARYYRQAFDLEPGLAKEHGLTAARCAARAGGESRTLALAWLRASLDSLRARAATDPASVTAALKRWKQADDLLDMALDEELPEAERLGWQALWADVDALLAKSAGR